MASQAPRRPGAQGRLRVRPGTGGLRRRAGKTKEPAIPGGVLRIPAARRRRRRELCTYAYVDAPQFLETAWGLKDNGRAGKLSFWVQHASGGHN